MGLYSTGKLAKVIRLMLTDDEHVAVRMCAYRQGMHQSVWMRAAIRRAIDEQLWAVGEKAPWTLWGTADRYRAPGTPRARREMARLEAQEPEEGEACVRDDLE